MYPGLFRRSVATLIDVAVVVAIITWIVRSPALADVAWLKIALAIAVPLTYEPVLSALACTVGQALMWTRVRDSETLERIPLRRAYLRWAMKYIVSVVGAGSAPMAQGATSVTVFPGGGHRALHDLQSRTVVVSAGHAADASGDL